VTPRGHAWRPLWLSPAAMLAAEMLAEAVSMAVDELVDAVLLELLDQRYRHERRRRPSRQQLHPAPAVQQKTARVIPLTQNRRRRAQVGGG
jgi:hypothetical protein